VKGFLSFISNSMQLGYGHLYQALLPHWYSERRVMMSNESAKSTGDGMSFDLGTEGRHFIDSRTKGLVQPG
jgi:hypothetical protein